MGLLATDHGLAAGDLHALQLLWGKLRQLGQLAQDNGYASTRKKLTRRVKLLVDAEHSWYQPAIDAYAHLLSAEFNRPRANAEWTGPLV
jgi:proline dehydrogenase